MKIQGVVTHSYPERRFLFIEGRNERGLFERFYSNFAHIVLCEPELKDIASGMVVLFTISPKPPKKAGGLRVALDVEIYKTLPVDAQTGVNTLAGKDTDGGAL